MNVNLSDIEWAVEFASMGYGDHEAYLDTETGAIYYVGDAVEEPVPDDLFEHRSDSNNFENICGLFFP